MKNASCDGCAAKTCRKFRLACTPLLTSLEWDCHWAISKTHSESKRGVTRRSQMNLRDKNGAQEDPVKGPTRRVSAAVPWVEPGAATDLELMHAIQKRDPEALSQLYDRYNGILKALILRVIHNEAEADDLLQEIFMEIWNQSKNFSAQKGKPLGWMVTLARRRAIDGLRKKQAYARAEER